ncbi:MAG: ferritin family protein [Dehalococcoidales bacterium]|jgi:rubrerythrin|nr:ferritin family protein [Dehalococcoidales bacterium]
MPSERQKTIEALKTAIQMEIDGKEFYLKASRESRNELGKKLLESLSSEEDYHREKFEQIFASIEKEKSWPDTGFQPDNGKHLKTIFSNELEKSSVDKQSLHSEIDTVQKAMEMESASREFYRQQMALAKGVAERQFYSLVSDEERVHFLVLLDYFEYLKDPAGWFVDKEHPSFDGG